MTHTKLLEVIGRDCKARGHAPPTARTRRRGTDVVVVVVALRPLSGCRQKYAEALKDWDTLFTASTRELKKLAVKPQQRKWILGWTEKYRQGIEPYLIPIKAKPKKSDGGASGGKRAAPGAASAAGGAAKKPAK